MDLKDLESKLSDIYGGKLKSASQRGFLETLREEKFMNNFPPPTELDLLVNKRADVKYDPDEKKGLIKI